MTFIPTAPSSSTCWNCVLRWPPRGSSPRRSRMIPSTNKMRDARPQSKTGYTLRILATLALIYAAFAGLRTVGDMDLGWQLATGRWIVQHRSIPSVDVLSYTARGSEWIYPALSQVLLYWFFLLGGYALLSWLGVAACTGT